MEDPFYTQMGFDQLKIKTNYRIRINRGMTEWNAEYWVECWPEAPLWSAIKGCQNHPGRLLTFPFKPVKVY